jgi:hypothetical protein
MRTQLALAAIAASAALAAHAEGTTLSGKVFSDFTWRQNVDSGANRTLDAGTGLDVKRFYFTVDHAFDDVWSARFRSDIGDLNKRFDVFVKHAYIQMKIAPELALRAGAADLPWVPFVEDLYGYRYVENVLVDRTKFGTSADWGLHALGKLGGGLVSYHFSAVSGRGYSDPTRPQAPMFAGRIALSPVKSIVLAVGGEMGKLGQNLIGVSTPQTAQRADALIAWVGDFARLGVDGFYAHDYSAAIVTGKAPEDSAVGVSGWGSLSLIPQVSLFVRVDFVKPNKDTNSGAKNLYFDAGAQFEPVKAVDLALVVKRDNVDTGPAAYSLSTANAKIGSTVANSSGTYTEVGLFTQYSF